jgi:3-hydroxyisobutyrate dehydrogenase-like beta-hydroxyacid dehydrogenase
MAGHLARAGHPLAVWNRTREKADAFVAAHGTASGAAGAAARVRAAATPADAARGAAVVFCCTGEDAALRETVLGADGAFLGMSPGAVFVDHTTASAEIARTLADEAKARGLDFLDAPVSGGEDGAKRGALTIMAGGDEAAFARVRPVLAAYAKKAEWMGPAGAGQLTKMVNQICIAGLVEALAEGLSFARRAGLDPAQVVDVISQGAAQSWQMENRAATMIEGRFDFGFAVDWMRKDLGLVLGEARRNGARLPVAALVDQLYAAVQARGGGRWDTSSLLTLLED